MRKAASKLSPVMQIEQNSTNEEFTVTAKTIMFTREEKFSIGKVFETAQMDGSKSKVNPSAPKYNYYSTTIF